MSSIKIFSLPNHLRVEERSANKTVIDKKMQFLGGIDNPVQFPVLRRLYSLS